MSFVTMFPPAGIDSVQTGASSIITITSVVPPPKSISIEPSSRSSFIITALVAASVLRNT